MFKHKFDVPFVFANQVCITCYVNAQDIMAIQQKNVSSLALNGSQLLGLPHLKETVKQKKLLKKIELLFLSFC